MTQVPVGTFHDERWVRHETASFTQGDRVLAPGPYGDLGVRFPVVEPDRLWLVERIVAVTNTACQRLAVAVDRDVPMRRRATEEPADIVDYQLMPPLVCVLCRPFPIVVPQATRLGIEWKDPGVPPNAGMEVNARIDVTILRRV